MCVCACVCVCVCVCVPGRGAGGLEKRTEAKLLCNQSALVPAKQCDHPHLHSFCSLLSTVILVVF